jgi:CheY-like chemotaxis protein
LVVDDDTAGLLSLQKRLSAEGLEVLTATHGAGALECARRQPVDAITLDVALPGELDGLGIAAALQQDPRTARIPIIFVTGTADDAFKEKCRQAGGQYFISKPYDGDVLTRLLQGIFATDELAEIKTISMAKRRQPVRGALCQPQR